MASLSISPIKTFSRSVLQHAVNAIPQMTVSSERANKAISWIGEHISSPENRLILGVTALMSQPFIDLHNRDVDEKTRKVSAARTVAKIIAGTTTGVIIRKGCIKAIDSFTKMAHEIPATAKHKHLLQLFTPSQESVKTLAHNLEQYKKSLGTILAVVVMVFTNFLIDAPLTKFLTNKFVAKINEKEKAKNAAGALQTANNNSATAKVDNTKINKGGS